MTPSSITLTLPPLENGDKLTRLEFERRYTAMSEVKKAELIEGFVYMSSPVRMTQHIARINSEIGSLAEKVKRDNYRKLLLSNSRS